MRVKESCPEPQHCNSVTPARARNKLAKTRVWLTIRMLYLPQRDDKTTAKLQRTQEKVCFVFSYYEVSIDFSTFFYFVSITFFFKYTIIGVDHINK